MCFRGTGFASVSRFPDWVLGLYFVLSVVSILKHYMKMNDIPVCKIVRYDTQPSHKKHISFHQVRSILKNPII